MMSSSSSSSSATDIITKPPPSSAVESVTCDTCGFAEECTPAYIHRVKERHRGHWLCGLCAEAVKDEVVRSPTRISVEEALRRHTTFCHRFRSWSAEEEEEDPIAVIGRILRRSLDGSPRRTTTRTSSSGALPGVDDVAARRSLLRSGSSSNNFAIIIISEKNVAKKMMHMTFYWGIKATILFDFWKTDSWLSYILTLVACFAFAAFYQYLEKRRVQFKSLSSTRHPNPPPRAGVSAPLLPKSGTRSAAKAASVLLFGVNAAIGYLLMLAVMSFNGGVFIAIVVGLTVGYLVFRSDDDGADVAAENPCALSWSSTNPISGWDRSLEEDRKSSSTGPTPNSSWPNNNT
ncbi:hypothetical protein Bca4012_045633 [Brassica carinata]